MLFSLNYNGLILYRQDYAHNDAIKMKTDIKKWKKMIHLTFEIFSCYV